VLDVAAGNGNVALAAARCGCEVVATDIVPALLERAQLRAKADGLPLRTQEANAEQLPFRGGEFDAVVSTFGVMFAGDQAAAAAELVRVCRPGGRIGLCNWTPRSFIADLFLTIRRHLPAPPGASSPMVWGDERGVRNLLGKGAEVRTAHRFFQVRFRSPQHFLDEFRTYYGPTLKAFAALPPDGAEKLAGEMLALAAAQNRADDTLVIPSEYLEVVALRR
jgi:SAM-dependent methyltransferase